jgi:hypothetical protein
MAAGGAMTRNVISEETGGIDSATAAVRDALLKGAVSITITIDDDWQGCELLLTRPKGAPDVDETRALRAAMACIVKELKSRAS